MLRKLLAMFIIATLSSANIYAEESFGNNPQVKTFIKQMAKKHKFFKEKELQALFNDVKVRPTVMRSIRAPLEENPWYRYQMMFVTEWRIREGVNFWNKYAEALERAEKTYGVPASIIVATIGVETKYGRNTGNYRVIDALTNIGFSNSSRAKYFKNELEEFLLLSHEHHLNPLKVYGSYAGAIGQPQFMPSSYRHYAINFSGSGKIDLSHNVIDVIGSIANYYNKNGWKNNQPVASPASVNGYQHFRLPWGRQTTTVTRYSNYGILKDHYNTKGQKSKLIELKGHYQNEYWLGFHNFDVIKRYNTSTLYAMAVYQLSEYISTVRGRLHES